MLPTLASVVPSSHPPRTAYLLALHIGSVNNRRQKTCKATAIHWVYSRLVTIRSPIAAFKDKRTATLRARAEPRRQRPLGDAPQATRARFYIEHRLEKNEHH